MLKQWSAALFAAIMLTACASVTVRPDGGAKLATKPDYQQSKNYFFWGLGGVHTIDVVEVCGEAGAEQFQSQYTFMNGFLTVITLGIYAPKTAKVGCKEEAAQ